MNIRTTVTGSVADFERCAGACEIRAKNAKDEQTRRDLIVAGAAIRAFLTLEYGDDEISFVNRFTMGLQGLETNAERENAE